MAALTLIVAALWNAQTPPPPVTMHDPFIIWFERDKIAIDNESRHILSNFTHAALTQPMTCVQVFGHADRSEGSDSVRLDLSRRRAKAVKRFLANAGLVNIIIRAGGVSDLYPLVSGPHVQNQYVSIDVCP